MKIKIKSKTKVPSDLANQADSLATQYQKCKEVLKTEFERENRVKGKIKDLAKKFGKKVDEARTVVMGKHSMVGFQVIDPSHGVDINKARKLLHPKIFRQCVKEVIDNDAVEKLVRTKKIPAQLFMQLLIETRSAQERIVVQQI